MKGVIQRLKKLEQIAPERLVILADFDGIERECYIDELEANPNANFIRVISGNNINDVDRILNLVEAAMKE